MSPDELDIERQAIIRIGNYAVREAQLNNLKNGIPNVYSKNGVIYYQLPDLSITMESPFKKDTQQ